MTISAFGVEDPRLVSKAKKQKPPSAGRQVAGTFIPGWHGAFAGKKGHKLRAIGNELGGGFAGSTAGTIIGRTLSRGNPTVGAIAGDAIGGVAGTFAGTRHAQSRGHYKKEK